LTKIISYNINGIRAALRKGLDDWLKATNADIVCLQELKANKEQFDENIFISLGYSCFWNSAEKPGYSGVAILTKIKPKHVEYGCGIKEIDFEGRIIRVDFDDFSVMSAYFPSGSSGDARQVFKMKFLSNFQDYINNLKKTLPNLIISGDYNIRFNASSEDGNDSLQVRTMVKTPLIWQIVGIGIIALVIAGIAVIFERLSRR